MHPGLEDLVVELLYNVQLYALSETLPHVSRHLYRIFKFAPPSFHAEYLLGRVLTQARGTDGVITRALKYPLCTMDVVDALCRCDVTPQDHVLQLPGRFFRDLHCRGSERTEHDHPLPFLKYLCNRFHILVSFHGYELEKAARAWFLPLISVLLDHCTAAKQTHLSLAVVQGYEAVVALLLAQNDIDVNSKDVDGLTPLSLAIQNWDTGIVMLLLARDDIDVNSKDVDGKTPLFWAVIHNFEILVKLLLARDDIDVNSKDVAGKTPLAWAASNGREGVVKLLLGRDDIDVNSKDVSGKTPLARAAYRGRKGVVKLLLARDDVDVHSMDVDGMTALSLATVNGHTGVRNLLLARDDIERDWISSYCCFRVKVKWSHHV